MEIILWKNAKKRIFRVYSAKKAQTNGFIAFVEKNNKSTFFKKRPGVVTIM
ncbi:MAG: hypothetical protein IKX20_00150 [Paludibacteraceae bacterium]|nr:hypothetical protein [Paludibacteraceae bacterium]